MNGLSSLLLDTNALISVLQKDPAIQPLISQADRVAISIISAMEFLAYDLLTESDKVLFDEFLLSAHVICISSIDSELVQRAISLRRQKLLKLPDAMIAATAISEQAVLVTRDARFARLRELQVQDF